MMTAYRTIWSISAAVLAVLLAGAVASSLTGCKDQATPGSGAPGSSTPAAGAPGELANVRCPIMGSPIDPANVTPALTRTYEGQKVAFCCPGCPEAWDKLTDEQKQTKLAAARAK